MDDIQKMDEINQLDSMSHEKKKEVAVPKDKFDLFYKEFEYVEDIVETDEWKEIYSNYYDFDKSELGIKINESEYDIESYDSEKQISEIIKCVNSFSYFCHKYVRINHPIHGLIPFKLYAYQKRVIDEYTSNRFNILSKFRQGGLTTTSVLWSMWRCLFQVDQQIMVMSKTDREAIAAGEIVKRALEHLPEWLMCRMGKNNDHEKEFKSTGSRLSFYTPEAARGKSCTLLIIDEAAFIPYMEKHWKSMYPVIATGGACCVVSTVNGLGNWYEEIYHEAENNKNPFNVIDLDFWEHPEYNDPEWVKSTRANLGEKGWQQEVLRSFLGSGETYISPNIIAKLDKETRDRRPLRALFEKWTGVGRDKDEVLGIGAFWVFQEPIEGHEYIIGVDCAEGVGEGGDHSVFQVLDQATLEQVAEFYSNTVPPHEFSQILNETGYLYNTALIVVENLGIGSAIINSLIHDLSYENMFYGGNRGKQQQPGIKTNKSNRPVILETLQNRLINNVLKINSHRFVDELKTFIFNATRKAAEAQKGKHDDAIMALSFAIHVRDLQMRDIPIGADVPAEMIHIFKSEVYEEIRQEVKRGAPEDWLSDEDEEPIFIPNDDVLSPVLFDINRPKDRLLKEFGW